MPWNTFIRVAICVGLLAGAAACVSDQRACSGQGDYWGCMQYQQAQRGASQAAMSQAAASQLAVSTRPLYVSPLAYQPQPICGVYGCY